MYYSIFASNPAHQCSWQSWHAMKIQECIGERSEAWNSSLINIEKMMWQIGNSSICVLQIGHSDARMHFFFFQARITVQQMLLVKDLTSTQMLWLHFPGSVVWSKHTRAISPWPLKFTIISWVVQVWETPILTTSISRRIVITWQYVQCRLYAHGWDQ